MDYSRTPLTGKDLLKKNILKEGEQFKVDYLKKNFKQLRLMTNGERHIEFVNSIDDRLSRDVKLSEAQIKYLDSLFNQVLGE